jgi:hypothetical protein
MSGELLPTNGSRGLEPVRASSRIIRKGTDALAKVQIDAWISESRVRAAGRVAQDAVAELCLLGIAEQQAVAAAPHIAPRVARIGDRLAKVLEREVGRWE